LRLLTRCVVARERRPPPEEPSPAAPATTPRKRARPIVIENLTQRTTFFCAVGLCALCLIGMAVMSLAVRENPQPEGVRQTLEALRTVALIAASFAFGMRAGRAGSPDRIETS